MRAILIFSITVVLSLAAVTSMAPSVAQAQEGGVWTSSDEAWYERNRRFSLAGKILTIAGVAVLIAGASSDEAIAWGPGGLVQTAGQLTWAGSDLRAANELRRRGYEVPKVSGVLSMVGAVVLPPMTWIAGPIQSARIRRTHDRIAGPSDVPLARSFGLTLRAEF